MLRTVRVRMTQASTPASALRDHHPHAKIVKTVMHDCPAMVARLGTWLCCGLLCAAASRAADEPLNETLDRAGANRAEIQKALDDAPPEQRAAMQFLVANMPGRDLGELSADFLLENVRLAYLAWNEAPWKKAVPQGVFFNDVLPYANINEKRDRSRRISTSVSGRWCGMPGRRARPRCS